MLRWHEDSVYSAEFSPDGLRVVTAGRDKTARVYVVHIENSIELAKTRVTRDLTCEEQVQYLREDIVCPTPTPVAAPTLAP